MVTAKSSIMVAIIYFSTFIITQPVFSEPSGATLLKFGQWYYEEGGPALQKALGHKGFKSWKPSVPMILDNGTNQDIKVTVSSTNCDAWTMTLKAGWWQEYSCDSGSGDSFYDVRYLGDHYTIVGATYNVLEHQNNKIEILDYTDSARSSYNNRGTTQFSPQAINRRRGR